MATLQSIRKHSGWLVAVIGLALFAFIAGDAAQVLQPHQNSQNVGEINGNKIDAQAYQKLVEEYTQAINFIRGNNSLTEAENAQIKDEVWSTLVTNTLVGEQAKKLGLTVTTAELQAAIDEKGAKVVADPALAAFISFSAEVFGPYGQIAKHKENLAKARQAYTAGLLEWKKGEPSYPDANFTMRLTYGTVKGYSPKDGVLYNYYTTLKGVMEKEDPNNWEFVVPEKLKTLWETKDFGQYARPDGKMPVAFLSNNDITGGNSGSPIMNAKGELIGLAFDGNWESMSSDVMFEPDLQRCINVDIRYVLFIVEKFGGAKWLIDEMTIVK